MLNVEPPGPGTQYTMVPSSVKKNLFLFLSQCCVMHVKYNCIAIFCSQTSTEFFPLQPILIFLSHGFEPPYSLG